MGIYRRYILGTNCGYKLWVHIVGTYWVHIVGRLYCGHILGTGRLLLVLAVPTSRMTNCLAVLIVHGYKKVIKVTKITFHDIWSDNFKRVNNT